MYVDLFRKERREFFFVCLFFIIFLLLFFSQAAKRAQDFAEEQKKFVELVGPDSGENDVHTQKSEWAHLF